MKILTALSRRSFHPVLQLPPFVVLVGNCHPLVLQDNVVVSKNRGTPKWMVYNGTPY